MTRARLRFPSRDPIEFDLDEVASFGPEITGFRAWLGAVAASREGRWIIRFTEEDSLLGFQRGELKKVQLTPEGAELTFGEETVVIHETDVASYAPDPAGTRAWLGRLAHGRGEAWVRLRDGRELRFPIGDGPHVSFLDAAARPG